MHTNATVTTRMTPHERRCRWPVNQIARLFSLVQSSASLCGSPRLSAGLSNPPSAQQSLDTLCPSQPPQVVINPLGPLQPLLLSAILSNRLQPCPTLCNEMGVRSQAEDCYEQK